jgi:hypothetical protein
MFEICNEECSKILNRFVCVQPGMAGFASCTYVCVRHCAVVALRSLLSNWKWSKEKIEKNSWRHLSIPSIQWSNCNVGYTYTCHIVLREIWSHTEAPACERAANEPDQPLDQLVGQTAIGNRSDWSSWVVVKNPMSSCPGGTPQGKSALMSSSVGKTR